MKKEYIKPLMKVVTIQQSKMICSSPGVESLSVGDEGFQMPDDGILDDEDDDV